jgi:hypothetical protein
MNRFLLLLLAGLALHACTGCLTLTALFNSKHLFPYKTRSTIALVAAGTDLFITMPAAGIAGYNYLSREREWRDARDVFGTVYGLFGPQLFMALDLGCAWLVYKLLWNEALFEKNPFRRRNKRRYLED